MGETIGTGRRVNSEPRLKTQNSKPSNETTDPNPSYRSNGENRSSAGLRPAKFGYPYDLASAVKFFCPILSNHGFHG